MVEFLLQIVAIDLPRLAAQNSKALRATAMTYMTGRTRARPHATLGSISFSFRYLGEALAA
jgi:hypothetical protein